MVENISIRSSQKYFKISPVKILKSLSRAEYLHHRQRNMNRTTIIKPNYADSIFAHQLFIC